MAVCVNVFSRCQDILFVVSFFACVLSIYFIPTQTPSDCHRGKNDKFHQFFDISQLKCIDCGQSQVFQTVTADALRCQCQNGMRIQSDYGGSVITCAPCGTNQIVSANGWECLNCSISNNLDQAACQCPNPAQEIIVERTLDGSFTGERLCEKCASNTAPDHSGARCTRCNQILSVISDASSCTCPVTQLSGGVCFRSQDDLLAENAELYKIIYASDLEVNSAYFVSNIRAARGMCGPAYGNLTACQTLGNMCGLLMYSRSKKETACSLYLHLAGGQGRALNEWPVGMPWLYYLEDTADQILTDTNLITKFTFPNSRLKFKVAAYTLNGTYLGIKDVTNGLLQLCKSAPDIMDAAYHFGTSYLQTCDLDTSYFWDEEKYPLVFYDMFIEMEGRAGYKELYAIPVLISNYLNQDQKYVNKYDKLLNWQLVRRFFLVDNVSGRTIVTSPNQDASRASGAGTTSTSRPKVVRFAESIKIVMHLQDDTSEGRIYPPYLRVTYGIVKESDYEARTKRRITFSTSYTMNMFKYNQNISIMMGVLSSLSVMYSFIQAWGWSKRSAMLNMDLRSIAKFLYFCMCNLSDTCVIVALGSSLWWLLFYKQQTVVYLLLPTAYEERILTAYISSGFALKAIQLFFIIANQITVDIFFIDWERPRGKARDTSSSEAPVSIWRTYFLANEWNEIQTTRKVNRTLQLFVVLFFLSVVGVENMASADPHSRFTTQPGQYKSTTNTFFRFGVSALTYLIVALVQWIFYTSIYQRFIEDPVRQYVDLCSIANVSVFILSHSHFGYYIHGRSVHGRADTDMSEMRTDLKREEENLCGQRGLLANTEQQTFQIAVPNKLRLQYDKVLYPINSQQRTLHSRLMTGGNSQGDLSIQAYNVINRFLHGFIDHSIRDIDYLIKDKLLLESVLDVEFQDASDRGIFYNDDGHSFDQVLFFGHEKTLLLFEILLFSVIDLASENFVLAAILTYLIMGLIIIFRNNMSQKNLSRKTLIDKRFLI